MTKLGAGTSSQCPRKGSVLLESPQGNVAFVNTTCMSWRCAGCRDRIKARFRKVVSTGVSTLGRCAFMTVTYKAGSERLSDAQCVRRDWTALLRKWKCDAPWISQMAWLRVMELTKAGTPHHHVVIGPIPAGKKIRCWNGRLLAREYLARRACDCLAHAVSRAWEEITGDSWVVHTMAVIGANRAGGYLCKYMGKEFDGERAEALGMERRWSRSRDWPGIRRNRLAWSKAAGGIGFPRAVYSPGHVDETLLALGNPEVLRKEREATAKEKAEAVTRFVNTVRKGRSNVVSA